MRLLRESRLFLLRQEQFSGGCRLVKTLLKWRLKGMDLSCQDRNRQQTEENLGKHDLASAYYPTFCSKIFCLHCVR
jgi:hypothetical protein